MGLKLPDRGWWKARFANMRWPMGQSADRPLEFRPFALEAMSAIRTSYQLAGSGFDKILIVAFEGQYGFGSAGNQDARFMYAMAAAGVKATEPKAVIFDFRKLRYQWGDMLEIVYDASPRLHDGGQAFAVIVGPECREAVRTLELGQNSAEPLSAIPWAHETLESARAYLNA
jgi:hypothetical protein